MVNQMKFKIYLADLIYDVVKTNFTVPLNIGCIAANAINAFKNDVEITLFKYPAELEKAIKTAPPDMMGFSNYSWNARLNLFFANLVKKNKSDAICVFGGPNIKIDPDGIYDFLKNNRVVDYYILHEGEKPFENLVKFILSKKNKKVPNGCATIINDKLVYSPINLLSLPKSINYPSPYLMGLLDKYLADPIMIPLLETNRGCPFGCAYCAWGILSKIRLRDIDVVKEEIRYIAEKSAKQAVWSICDANFGIIERDIEIAQTIKDVMKKNGFPKTFHLSNAKNAAKRNIKISEILGYEHGLVAIQSTDKNVLKNCGRGSIRMQSLLEEIKYYKDINMETHTHILIGLPGETAESHLKTLADSFDMGFDFITPMNIRMLPGTKYDSIEYREKYGVKTKYRPIFGSYGIYDNRLVFELEEGIRATKDMTEKELNDFKVLHWLIYFAWDAGIFKPFLKFGKEYDINPVIVLHKLTLTMHPVLSKIFDEMKDESMDEWFATPQAMIDYYNIRKNFDTLINDFVKLNQSFTALFYQNEKIILTLLDELLRILEEELKKKNAYQESLIKELINVSDTIICKDLLEENVSRKITCSGRIATIILGNKELLERKSVEIEIYRPDTTVALCHFFLNPNGKRDFSIKTLTRFFDMGGQSALTNKIRLLNSLK
jgi:radical SAM superfamily enzyme YgiQ (UPF0313 family)